ncbi:Gcd10p family-domain-containing protein [Cunninghamella echinulata]|nr:Gcd10p family-domain-containing protein [Cunninghamella echinulata]
MTDTPVDTYSPMIKTEQPALQDDIEEDFPHITENQYVLIAMPSGNVKMLNIKADTKINLGKFGTFLSDNLIGQPFGLSYEILDSNGNIRPVKNYALEAVEETKANNQTIVDERTVQALTQEEVEQLKLDSFSGKLQSEEVIQRIVDSHKEFDKKTEYSKFKYLERKKKKFMKMFTPIRPTLYSINDYFFNKNPDKIKFLRVDTLSQLLSRANVRANSKLLIVDDTQGLIVAAAAERMGGYGTIVGIHDGDNNNFDVVRYMNFSKRILSSIHTVPIARVDSKDANEVWVDKPEEDCKDMSEDAYRSYLRSKAAMETRNHARDLLFEGNFDGLIISSYYQIDTIIETFLPYVSGSRPVIAYSHAKESLLPAANFMRQSKDFIDADITESFLRQYQVLPGRTHPEMSMSAGGGYLLSALRVIDCPFDPALVVREENTRRKRRKTKAAKEKQNDNDNKGGKDSSENNNESPL